MVASERVRAAGCWSARFAVLDRLLGATLDADRGVPDEVARAWGLLLRTGGTMPIRDVARDVGWSQRHLSTMFVREIGLRPKTAARVIRFDRARRVLERNVRAERPNIAGVAADCGYFDQAHLIRDWQQFTGLAPTEWIAAEFGNFQVRSVEHPASSTA